MPKRAIKIKSPFYELKEIKTMSESKSIELTVGERMAALRILNAFKGDTLTLKAILEDVKQFPVSEEEWKEAELVKTKAEGDLENWQWNDKKVIKEVTVQNETSKYLKDEIKKKSDALEITVADAPLITLGDKL